MALVYLRSKLLKSDLFAGTMKSALIVKNTMKYEYTYTRSLYKRSNIGSTTPYRA